MAQEQLVLGIDIGGTSIKFGLVALESYEIIHEFALPTPLTGPEAMVTVVAEEVLRIRSQFRIRATIGVGVPGAMNRDRTLVRNPPNLPGWGLVPLKAMLEAVLKGLQFEVDNDAKVATLAEATLGAGRGLDHFLMITLGTGVGGGIWAEGKIFRGATGGAGEFGLTSVVSDGTPLERMIGQRFLSQRTLQTLATSNVESTLRSFLSDGELEPKEIVAAAIAGDLFATRVLAEAGSLLGMACANVAKLLDLYIFVVGGGVAEAGEWMLGPAFTTLRENVLPHQKDAVKIVRAELGNRAGVLGAVLLASSQDASV